LEIARLAREALLSKKGEDIVILDVRGLSSVTDYYVIATAQSPPQIKAMATELDHVLQSLGCRCYRRSGTAESQWIVADYLDAVVHIFSQELRSFYALEKLWSDAKQIVGS